MAIDWLARLREQGRFAARMSRDVPAALGDPQLSLDEAAQLHRTVENCASSFDAILLEMERARLEKEYFRAAETVSQLWADMSVMAADKVRALRGGNRRRA